MIALIKKIRVNQIIAILLALTVVAGAIVFALKRERVSFSATPEEISEFAGSIELRNGFHIISTPGCCDKTENTLEAIQAGIDAGARTVELDVAFREDGTPVLAKSFDYINENSVLLSEALEIIVPIKAVHILINLTEFSSMRSLYELIKESEIEVRRVSFSGVDSDTVSEYMKFFDIYNFYYYIDFSEVDSVKDAISDALKTGAYGIRFDFEDISDELTERIKKSPRLHFIIDGAQTEDEFYKALSLKPDGISADYPDKLRQIILKEDFYG